jgi:predicted ABC-type transport system involved in lysophospholipase L1 biosynthesis ATPase subunit
MTLFQQLNGDGRTIVLVTHDPQIVAHCKRVARLEQGRIVSDEQIACPRQATAVRAAF